MATDPLTQSEGTSADTLSHEQKLKTMLSALWDRSRHTVAERAALLQVAGNLWVENHLDEATRLRAVIPVWRDPWMVVGSATFTGDLAARLGLDNVFGDDPGRYPRVGLADVAARRPELVVLPDEPYAFGAGDGPEMFPGRRVALVEGRSLTWYGPSLVTARDELRAQLAAARPGG